MWYRRWLWIFYQFYLTTDNFIHVNDRFSRRTIKILTLSIVSLVRNSHYWTLYVEFGSRRRCRIGLVTASRSLLAFVCRWWSFEIYSILTCYTFLCFMYRTWKGDQCVRASTSTLYVNKVNNIYDDGNKIARLSGFRFARALPLRRRRAVRLAVNDIDIATSTPTDATLICYIHKDVFVSASIIT